MGALSEYMKIWCNIQVIINRLLDVSSLPCIASYAKYFIFTKSMWLKNRILIYIFKKLFGKVVKFFVWRLRF